ncbi:MAG TPA: hypothetical protein VKA43_04285, partial [Gammaproteobacteria bacterium]|nr:hypothetical protein [Gammaproteobacteria bacterium]
GYWVSPIMEDWRWRMVTPLKGDAASIPVNAAARALIDAWDPAKDEAAGDACKAYGAPALLRLPGRLRIGWRDENTIEIETDTGQQTRLLHFDRSPPRDNAPSRQGYSQADWSFRSARGSPAVVVGLGMAPGRPAPSRTLEVTTTRLLPGYLRKNGIPYSGQATVTEYFDRFTEPDGAEWFTVTTIVTDPVYLGLPFVTTTDFRKERDGSKWDPRPCSTR